jgi:glycosyltransferase involved in cell wall biosynthesis
MNPLISVIIPTYNHAHFLEKAIQSVVNQTYTNWEIIVIDNHSDDSTDEVVNGFQDQRISLLKVHNNGIIALSRNVGIKVAKGKLIAFLDSDDLWYPSKLEYCIAKINSGYDMVCHSEIWVRVENGVRQERKVLYGPESDATFNKLLFEGNCISTSAFVVQHSDVQKVGGFDESPDMITAEDYHLWLKLARLGVRIGFVDEVLGEYKIHAGNSSKAALRSMNAIRTVFEKVYSEMDVHTLIGQIKSVRRRAIIIYSGARGFQENREFVKAVPLFIEAIFRWPFIPKFYIAMFINLFGRRR